MERLKIFYNRILSQTISDDGKWLFCGNNYGDIFVYSIPHICMEQNADSQETRSPTIRPIQIFKMLDYNRPIYSLLFHNNFLIVGTVGRISGFSWVKNEITKKAWEVKLSSVDNKDSIDPIEVNSMWLDKANSILYAGCGDNQIYAISLEDGRILRDFSGHKDYIHCVCGSSNNQLYSASEDGTVKFWDGREKRSTGQLEPYKNDDLQRENFGKFQGTVAVSDSDWLICGGGPKFSLWHLRSLQCAKIYSFPGKVHECGFVNDIVYVAGEYKSQIQYRLNGDTTAEVPVTGPAVYSVVWQLEPNRVMSIAGASNNLDICTDFNYKDIVLSLYEKKVK